MSEQGADAVLISRLASTETGHAHGPPSGPSSYYGSWRDYYGHVYQVMERQADIVNALADQKLLR